MPRLYDVEKTAELMSISPWTVRSYIRTGHITPVRIGRRVLIEQRELERVIAQGRQPALPASESQRRTAEELLVKTEPIKCQQ